MKLQIQYIQSNKASTAPLHCKKCQPTKTDLRLIIAALQKHDDQQ